MTTLLWQTGLLLLGAYFLGAWIACIARRLVYLRTAEVQPAVERQPVPAAVVPASPPPRLAEVEPIGPKIEVLDKSAGEDQPGAAASARAAAIAQAIASVPRESPTATATAAAAAAAAAHHSVSSSSPPPSVAPQRGILPAAAGSMGQSSTSAPDVRAIAQPAGQVAGDDLTHIRSIDVTVRAELDKLGVRRFADIAAWRKEDVARVSTALNIAGRIEKENWIEQAQILASGGQTAYSERIGRGERPTAVPTSDEGEPRKPEVPTKPAVSAEASSPRPAPADAAVMSAGASLPRRTAVIGLGRDNLQRISQVSAEVEKLLNVQGVSRYDQIAGWGPSDVSKFDRLLGSDWRIARENWIEQAQILARGGETAYSRDFDQRASSTIEPLRPARLAEAIQVSMKAEAAGTRSDADGARRPDVAALRSVRSEALTAGAATGRVIGAAQSDDLKRIRGIGVLIEKRLNSLGIWAYEQIANWTSADIERVSRVLDFKGRIERESWVEQARILASGGQTEFARRVERGEVETSRSKP